MEWNQKNFPENAGPDCLYLKRQMVVKTDNVQITDNYNSHVF